MRAIDAFNALWGRRHRKRRLVRELGGSRQGNRHPWWFSPDDRDWLCSPDRSRRCVSLHMLVTAAEFLLGPSLELPQLKHVGFSVQRMVFAVEIARFGAILKREADHRDRTPLALSQFGCRHQAVASGEGSAHNLTPLVSTDGGVGREAGEQWPGGRWSTHVDRVPRSA